MTELDAASLPLATPPAASDSVVPGGVLTRRAAVTPFEVHLDVFEGPFDLLLGLIAKHKLDITEIALAKVTDEFIAHLTAARSRGTEWDLSQASEFLLVAATLLDLKAARLLPSTGPDDDEDLALIEARDLLFARLLQYRAFKDLAATFAERMATHGRLMPRQAGLEPRFAALMPELIMGITRDQLAMIAARAMMPKVPPSVSLEHLHAVHVSVAEQAALLVKRLRESGEYSFRDLVADAESTLVIVARFLAVLELYRENAIAVEQSAPLADLVIRWVGTEQGEIVVHDDYDAYDDRNEPHEGHDSDAVVDTDHRASGEIGSQL